MTMELIDEIKKKKRIDSVPDTKTNVLCTRFYKNVFPFRVLALSTIVIMPFFTFDHWCVVLQLNHGKVGETCDPSVYPTSNFYKA